MASSGKHLNPFTDFGFKKLFGEEPNKDLLLDFLNELLKEEQGEIRELTYFKSEQLGSSQSDRKAVFDLYCTNERGEKFIVELQKTEQKYFKDRTVYYSTFPIAEQAKQGKWDFELKSVYMIAILDFVFDEGDEDKYRYDIKLTDIDTCKVFYDKLMFIYLEMPEFRKRLEEVSSHFDKRLYVLKHLPDLEGKPAVLQEGIFEKSFRVAELAKLSAEQVTIYQESVKHYRDIENSLSTAEQRGREEGRAEDRVEGKAEGIKEEKLEIAKRMLADGESREKIMKWTGLDIDALDVLQ